MAVDGAYKIEIDTPMGKQESKLTLKTAGNKLSGSIDSPFGAVEFKDGTAKGGDISWSMEINSPMGNMKLDYEGKVAGDAISGEVKAGDFGTSPFTGKRV
jgi:hypothetical protein